MGFWTKKDKQQTKTFSDIIRGLQYSVNTAQQILERHHLYLFSKYFDEQGVPVMHEFQLSENRKLNVPVISLIGQHALAIDEMEIEFNARITAVETKRDMESGAENEIGKENEKDDKGNNWIDRACFDVDFSAMSKSDNLLHVKIKFKAVDQPEGVSRVIDEYDKLVSPIDFIEKEYDNNSQNNNN